ncbi:putative uncharacterized protein [Bacteroides stercoris CAG:120]|nr:putative uncharacterized protein [Bacteroides stercoris CAG:120]
MLSDFMVRNITILLDCFCTVTPCTTTGAGSDDCATLTRFCTCTVAMSISVPTAKVTVSEYAPDEDELDDI